MATFTVHAINVGSFNLGESDKLLTLFTAERGLTRAVAKGARKPGAKMTGRSEVLNCNTYLVSTGRTLDIISQAETLESLPGLRKDLARLSFGLYYAELTQVFGQGLEQESARYFDYLLGALRFLALSGQPPDWLGLQFELGLLDMLGYRPELTYCITCRKVLTDYLLAAFHKDWGGIICRTCMDSSRLRAVKEGDTYQDETAYAVRDSSQITPLVWKQLVLASQQPSDGSHSITSLPANAVLHPSIKAARRLIQGYIEHRAGKRIKAAEFLASLEIT